MRAIGRLEDFAANLAPSPAPAARASAASKETTSNAMRYNWFSETRREPA